MLRFLPEVPGGELAATIKAALFTPHENVLFSLQNLRARSNKEAKDQTTKNSLESEFSVPRPLRAPWGSCGGGCCEGTGRPAGPPCAAADLQSRGREQGAGRTCGRRQGSRGTPPGPLSAMVSSSNLVGDCIVPSSR